MFTQPDDGPATIVYGSTSLDNPVRFLTVLECGQAGDLRKNL